MDLGGGAAIDYEELLTLHDLIVLQLTDLASIASRIFERI
jgi:hypothetical protein